MAVAVRWPATRWTLNGATCPQDKTLRLQGYNTRKVHLPAYCMAADGRVGCKALNYDTTPTVWRDRHNQVCATALVSITLMQ